MSVDSQPRSKSPPLRHSAAPSAAASAALVVFFCLLLLRADPLLFWNDDYQISILPVFADVARSWREGHWPLLSPYSWACGNLAGEYQYGTFSVFVNALVVAIWHLPLAFPQQAAALSIAHLVVLTAGAFLLARAWRLPSALATMVAFVAALNGWMIGWGATNWFGALAAFAWLPWCWWAFERALRPGAGPLRRLMLPALFVYLLVAGGFPYTVVMLALITLWLALRTGGWRQWQTLWPLAAGWVLGVGLAAPAWLSLLEYMAGSDRAHKSGLINYEWTVPLRALPGLILPSWTVPWADFSNRLVPRAALELAGGLVPVAALTAALLALRLRALRVLRWELLLLGALLLLCVLPSPGVFRWSFRWLPLFHLVLALTAARGLHRLFSLRHRPVQVIENPGVWATALILGVAAAGVVCAPATTSLDVPALVILTWMFVHARAAQFRNGKIWKRWAPAAVVFLSLLAAYHRLPIHPGVPKYRVGENLAQPAPLATDRLYLSFYREPDRHYWAAQTPENFGAVLRLGSTSLFGGVHLVNGYSPIMAAGVGRLLKSETHGNLFPDTAAWLIPAEAGSDGLLARLGVDGLIVARDYPLPLEPPPVEWERVHSSEEGDIFHRRSGALADVQSWRSAEPDGETRFALAQIRVVKNSRQRVVAQIDVPPGGDGALLAFRRPWFPGYRATLDGESLPVGSYRGLLPTVELPAGSRGELVLRYRPRAVVWGGALSAASLLVLIAAVARMKLKIAPPTPARRGR